MDESTRKVCEEILKEKIQALQQEYEQKISLLQLAHEEAIQKLKNEEVEKRKEIELEFMTKIDSLQKEYIEKTNQLKEEISFLNERHDSQRLMLSDTLSYVKQLEKEISDLREYIAKHQ